MKQKEETETETEGGREGATTGDRARRGCGLWVQVCPGGSPFLAISYWAPSSDTNSKPTSDALPPARRCIADSKRLVFTWAC